MAVTTLGLIVGGLIAGQTANAIVGDKKNAKAAKKLGEANAQIAERQGADALARGDESVAQVGAQERSLTGSQRASYAAQGIDVNSGSAADVVASDQQLSELDKLTIKRNAQREAHGYELQAAAYRKGGQLQAANYSNAAYGTLLSGAAQMIGVYQAFGQSSASVPRRASSSAGTGQGGYSNGTASR